MEIEKRNEEKSRSAVRPHVTRQKVEKHFCLIEKFTLMNWMIAYNSINIQFHNSTFNAYEQMEMKMEMYLIYSILLAFSLSLAHSLNLFAVRFQKQSFIIINQFKIRFFLFSSRSYHFRKVITMKWSKR